MSYMEQFDENKKLKSFWFSVANIKSSSLVPTEFFRISPNKTCRRRQFHCPYISYVFFGVSEWQFHFWTQPWKVIFSCWVPSNSQPFTASFMPCAATQTCKYQMIERLNNRHGLICIAFLFWTLATLHRFLYTAPQTSQNKPNIVLVKQVPEVPKVTEIPKVTGTPNFFQAPQLPPAFKLLERVGSLLSEGEAGFKSWWEKQLERRARVTQTCARFFNQLLGQNKHLLISWTSGTE